MSYVRTLYRDWKSGNSPMPGPHKLFCLQGGSRSWEFGYREELEKIAAEVPWFEYVATISRPWEDASWKGETGRVDDLVRNIRINGGSARHNHRLSVRPSEHVRKRHGYIVARGLAKGFHVRRGVLHPWEGSWD